MSDIIPFFSNNRKKIYLDYNSTAPLRPSAKAAMLEAFESWANPSAQHFFGKENAKKLEELRSEFREIFNIPEHVGVIFVNSSTQANNIILHYAYNSNFPILTSKSEHSSIYKFIEKPIEKENHENSNKRSGKFEIELADLQKFIEKEPSFISTILVNHETGMINDLKSIVKLAKKFTHKSIVHTDASQCKIINFKELGVDFMTISSHKMGGPIGIAALVTHSILDPIFLGGDQEEGINPGTVALPLIAGFIAAAKELKNSNYIEKIRELKNLLKNLISREYFLESLISGEEFSDHMACLILPFSASEMLAYMDLNGIAISAGSACTSGILGKMRSLRNLPEAYKYETQALRVSWGLETTQEEIIFFAETFNKFLEQRKKTQN